MRAKTFGLFALSIFALIFLMSAVNGVNFHPSTLTGSVQQDQTVSLTFIIENTHSQNLTNISMTKSNLTSGTNIISSSNLVIQNLPSTIAQGQNSSTVTLQVTVPSNQAIGTYVGQLELFGTLTAHDSRGILNVTLTVTPALTEASICAFDEGVTTNIGNYLKVDIKDITVTDGFGKDEEWLLFDEIEVKIRVENKGLNNYDIDDISLEWGIANDDLTDWAVDLDEIEEFDLKEDDEETFTITFKVDDDDLDMDLDELSGLDYNLVVRATGIVDDEDDLLTVDDTCAADFSEISIYEESDFVILDNIKMPETLKCGETATITADVWNIGDSDQDDVSVYIEGRESALGFSKTIEVGDIDAFDKQVLSFTFTVPKNLDEKSYALNFEVKDEDGDVYENDFDDDLSEFTVPFKVEGNCGAAEIPITAAIVSGGRAGDELVIKATITNDRDELKTYTINAAEFAAWADSVSLDQNTLVLNAGESRDVLFTFDVKKDAFGSQTFFIELVSGEEVTRQAVSVTIEPRAGFLTGAAIAENWQLWGLGLLNIILVVVIIIVAVRVARRR